MNTLDLSAYLATTKTIAQSASYNGALDAIQAAINALPKVSIGALSDGPPGTPGDGDIWIATAVDANDTRWAFQYNAGSASVYKWEFIGGGDAFIANSNQNAIVNTGTNISGAYYAVNSTFTPAREGDYQAVGAVQFFQNAGGAGDCVANAVVNGALVSGEAAPVASIQVAGANYSVAIPINLPLTGCGTSSASGVAFSAPVPGTYKIAQLQLAVRPRRIA